MKYAMGIKLDNELCSVRYKNYDVQQTLNILKQNYIRRQKISERKA